jgi:hypothetical protein
MQLTLQRERSVGGATFGQLHIDGVAECLTLEDEIRERPGVPVASWKIAGVTAIPAGIYVVQLTMSARFGRILPLFVDVPGFAGVRIHTGNAIEETEGCVLVGRRRAGSRISESRLAFTPLFAKLEAAAARREEMRIQIRNPA